MPKLSGKQKLFRSLEQNAIYNLIFHSVFTGKNARIQQAIENRILEELILDLSIVYQIRYAIPFIRGSVPRSKSFQINVLPYLDESRFKVIARMSRERFYFVLEQIKQDPQFNGPRSSLQIPLEMQLIIVLYRLGSYGEGASISKISCLFGVSDGGTIQNITDRILSAIIKLQSRFLYWPSAEERQQICSITLNEMPHCIGYVDGTEIKLAEKPSSDPEAYFSRKQNYSLKVQAVCDYRLRIRHLVLGYPGSVHDSRIFNNCSLSQKSNEYFSNAEWLAGDSAYKLTPFLLTPYRENSVLNVPEERAKFNKTFSKYRIRIEHCFGILKERFGSLKELKLQLKNEKSIKNACKWILVCAILHNMIHECDYYQALEEEYIQEFLDQESLEDEYLNRSSNSGNSAGEAKRQAIAQLIQ